MGACGGFKACASGFFEACASGFFECELLGGFCGFRGGFGSGEGAEFGEVAAEGSFGFKLWEKRGGWLVGVVKGSMTRRGYNVHLE